MGKLDGKVAVITGGTTGMALAGAKLFADEGAHVFITGRRQDALEAAVKQIGRNVISIIGTGNMARTIGALAVAGGNTVEVMGRDQSKAADLAKALGGGATTGEWGTAPAAAAALGALLHLRHGSTVPQLGNDRCT